MSAISNGRGFNRNSIARWATWMLRRSEKKCCFIFAIQILFSIKVLEDLAAVGVNQNFMERETSEFIKGNANTASAAVCQGGFSR